MITKRFLAGVTCPQCQLIDKTVLFKREGIEYTSCVRCGFERQQPTEHESREGKLREQPVHFVRSPAKTVRPADKDPNSAKD